MWKREDIPESILENWEYFKYLHEIIGWCSVSRPMPRQPLNPCDELQRIHDLVVYLIELKELENQRRGVMAQSELFDERSAAGSGALRASGRFGRNTDQNGGGS